MASKDYDAGKAFKRIEEELIRSMMRNLGRHLKEEEEEGFDWSQWQVEQLKYLEEYRRKNQDKFGPRFEEINGMIREAIWKSNEAGQKREELRILKKIAGNEELRRKHKDPAGSIRAGGDAFFRINDRKVEALVNATTNDLQRAERAVLRRTNDQYRKIIFDAQMYASSGAATPAKAVDMATKDFLSRGIDSIEYKNGSRHTISDYADMAVKTAERRAYLAGEGKKRQEWGEHLVIVNKRADDPCPHCMKWIGKILIDDVYSGGKPDGKHKLLSEAMEEGFLHPRCKDGFTTYFPGITSVPDPVTKEDVRKAERSEKAEAVRQRAERETEKYERLEEGSFDPENQRMYEARANAWKHDGLGMAAGETIEWPAVGKRIEDEQFKQIRDYADSKGIKLAGIKGSDLSVDLVEDAINKTAEMLERYNIRDNIEHPFIMDFSHALRSSDFATSYPGTKHVIYFNKDAYRSLQALEKEYAALEAKGFFAKGTTYKSIPFHEIGHLVADIYDIDPMEIARKVTKLKDDADILEYVAKTLSKYAGKEGGDEIIAECFSSVFSGGKNEFALKFVKECDKIISKRR